MEEKYYYKNRIKGHDVKTVLQETLENFPPEMVLQISLTSKSLKKQALLIKELIANKRKVDFDLNSIEIPDKNSTAWEAYHELHAISLNYSKSTDEFLLIEEDDYEILFKDSEYENHYQGSITGHDVKTVLKETLSNFPPEQILQISLTLKSLVKQTLLIKKLIAKGRKVDFDLSSIEIPDENTPAWDAYCELKEIKLNHPIFPNGLLWCNDPDRFLPAIEKGWDKNGVIRGGWFVCGKKPWGAVPGFFAVPTDGDFFKYFRDWLKKKVVGYSIFLPIRSLDKLIGLINDVNANPEDHPDAKAFLEAFAKSMHKKIKKGKPPLTSYMFKGEYEGKKKSLVGKFLGGEAFLVGPSIEQIENGEPLIVIIKQKLPLPKLLAKGIIRTAVEIKKRTRSLQLPIDENISAVLETFSTDILRVLGLPIQNQRLIFSCYPDGSPKIETVIELKKGVQSGGKNFRGGFPPTYEGNYIENPDQGGLGHWQSKKFKNGAQVFTATLATGNWDGAGANGDNKMIDGDSFFLIDEGCSLKIGNVLLKTLQTDFSFTQPFLITEKFKNITAFMDNSLPEKVEALYLHFWAMPLDWLNQCLEPEEINRIEAAIEICKEKNPDFSEKLQNVKRYGFIEVYDQYWNFFAHKLDEDISDAWREQIGRCLNQLHESYTLLAQNNCEMIKVLKQRMMLNRDQLMLLDRLEKQFSDEVSWLSPNKMIRLNYPRIVKGRVPFELEKDNEDNFILSFPRHKKTVFMDYLNALLDFVYEDISDQDSDLVKLRFSEESLILLQNHQPSDVKIIHEELYTDLNIWIDPIIKDFYNKFLKDISEKIPLMVPQISEEQLEENFFIPADESNLINYQLLKNCLQKNNFNSEEEINEDFYQKFIIPLKENMNEAVKELSLMPNQYQHLERQINQIIKEVQGVYQVTNSNCIAGKELIKYVALKGCKSLHDNFDKNYYRKDDLLAFLGSQAAMKRSFFLAILSIFSEETCDFKMSDSLPRVTDMFHMIEKNMAEKYLDIKVENQNSEESYIL